MRNLKLYQVCQEVFHKTFIKAFATLDSDVVIYGPFFATMRLESRTFKDRCRFFIGRQVKFNFLIRKMIDGNLNEVISPVEIDFTFKTKLVSANEFPSFRFRRTIFLKRKLTLSIPAFFPLNLATSALNPVMKNKNILTHYLRKEI